MSLEKYFQSFRKNIIGINAKIDTPYGSKPLIYADWIASGRLYGPIEKNMQEKIGPMVGNTHSEASHTGKLMTRAYKKAHQIIKNHVNASSDDVIITSDTGTTGVLCKFQRILGLKIPESHQDKIQVPEEDRPVVFISHMEHHSNQTTWLETIADVVVIEPTDNLFISTENLKAGLRKFENRKIKIGSFTACSNVTGVMTSFHQLAEIMHDHGGYCFVDFAASAPYVDINMHPENDAQRLDAIFFSPHKFLGGPGSSGVIIFNRELYKNRIPDHPGGGTVAWTNPWGEHSYFHDIEIREDGGTPGFLQAIRAAFSIRLKEEMSVEKIRQRENELVRRCFEGLNQVPGLHILAGEVRYRLGVFSFYIGGIHYNLIVKLLNDRYGIQVRGGCSCAGTYGHMLLHVSRERSKQITDEIDRGNLSQKPGWIRLSLHPTMTDDELEYILNAIFDVARHAEEWARDYEYSSADNEFYHHSENSEPDTSEWFVICH